MGEGTRPLKLEADSAGAVVKKGCSRIINQLARWDAAATGIRTMGGATTNVTSRSSTPKQSFHKHVTQFVYKRKQH